MLLLVRGRSLSRCSLCLARLGLVQLGASLVSGVGRRRQRGVGGGLRGLREVANALVREMRQVVRAQRRKLDAAGHAGGAAYANVKVIIVRQ